MNKARRATTVETAAQIRRVLKDAFPGVAFSVRSRTRGTDAIEVNWADGPTAERVETLVGRYQEGTFDGMTDSYHYQGGVVLDGVEYGVRWLHVNRDMSDAARTRFMNLLLAYREDLASKPDYEVETLAWREFVRWDATIAPLPETTDALPSRREYECMA